MDATASASTIARCAITACPHPIFKAGLCAGHYGNQITTGSPTPITPPKKPRPDGPVTAAGEPILSARQLKKRAADPKANPFHDFVARYRDDPVNFVRRVLHAHPLEWQTKLMRAVATGKRQIAVRSGHGVGKTTVVAWLLIWFLTTRFPCKAVVTAPTAPQLFDALFAELKAQINKLPDAIKTLLEITSDRVELKSAPESAFISARTASVERPEALQGIHSEHVLLVADEAPGVPEVVYEAGGGSMSSANAQTLLIGNPTRSSGYFFNAFHRNRDDWVKFHVNAAECALVAPAYVTSIARTYGLESNQYRVRVLGEFPLSDDDTLIPASLVRAAFDRIITPHKHAPIIWGLDVARFGSDRTVLCRRQGGLVFPFLSWRKLDLMQTVGRVKSLFDSCGDNTTLGPGHTELRFDHKGNLKPPSSDRPTEINVDAIGIGAGVADRLRELELGSTRVNAVNVAEANAVNPSAYRLRDDLWMQMHTFFDARLCQLQSSGADDDDVVQDLTAPTITYDSAGRLKIESKEAMRKRGMASPDYADALALTFAGQAAMIGGAFSSTARQRTKALTRKSAYA
jgi:phage terminase large subunit